MSELQAPTRLEIEDALTLPAAPGAQSPAPRALDWIAAFKAGAAKDTYMPQFGAGDPGSGDDGGSTDLGDIIVVGDPDYDDPYDDWWETGGSPGGEGPDPGTGSGTGGSGDGGEPVDPDCGGAADGPTPDGVDLGDLRDEARRIAAEIADRESSWEWGALIYILDGQIYSTEIITQQHDDSVGFPYGSSSFLPNGAHIVGWLHSHPYDRNGPDQGRMSGDDAGAYETMTANANDRYTVDTNLMTYVLDNETGKLTEFDEGDREGARGVDATACGG
ncbi:hypothetical protein [Brevundimonas sp. A19_0]|uniref:hypothetical protein n=1 Tax=Brevundimonas sp. A19_0 TaxID=2821087 RepID=UPI001ADCFB79|nr:hypothetical protein [Brevundimonas sp. A19_0]MBO9500911.1 hypothetical protein [Brevundimonas sp. A19_0]